MAQKWSGRLVLYAGDNMNVTSWLKKGGAGNLLARALLRILRFLQATHYFQILPVYLRTYHNETADLITRASYEEYTKEIKQQGLRQIDISESWERLVATDPALLDCAVLHTDPEDVRVAAELRKQRRARGVGPDRQGHRLPPLVE